MVVTGPVTHYIYQFLEGIVGSKQSGVSSLKKAILERLMFAPPYLLALFYFVARMEVSKNWVAKLLCMLQRGIFSLHFRGGLTSKPGSR